MVTGDTKIRNNKTCPQELTAKCPCLVISIATSDVLDLHHIAVIFLPPAPDCPGFLQSIHSLLRLCWLNAFPKIIDSSRNSLAGNIPIGLPVSTESPGKDFTLIISLVHHQADPVYLWVSPASQAPSSTSSLQRWSWSWNSLMFIPGPIAPGLSLSFHLSSELQLKPRLFPPNVSRNYIPQWPSVDLLRYLYTSLTFTLNHKYSHFYFLSLQTVSISLKSVRKPYIPLLVFMHPFI